MRTDAEQYWTKAAPTEPGWYWWRENISQYGKIVYVSQKLYRHEMDIRGSWHVKDCGGEWSGPLQEPGGDAVENYQHCNGMGWVKRS